MLFKALSDKTVCIRTVGLSIYAMKKLNNANSKIAKKVKEQLLKAPHKEIYHKINEYLDRVTPW